MKAYSDRDWPRRDLAPLPPDRQPWLLVLPAVLVTPFPVRKGGLTQAETKEIKAMQRRLSESPVGIWSIQTAALLRRQSSRPC
jgi:hypothetical protein